MTLVPWIKGQPLVWDVTIVDTLADLINVIGNRLFAESGFLRGYPLLLNVETLQADSALLPEIFVL
jgi:hypothetical protein